VVHAHTSDDKRGFPGLGGWDQRPFLRSLKAAGYDARLSFEVGEPFSPAFAERAQRSIERMRELHADIARS
jgi:sugar phosphate isomerase/epimerase